MLNYSLKYKTFNQLLAEAEVDFRNYALENMIEPQQLIKVAKRVNYDLGLRISMTKETVLEVEHGRVKLPDDFYIINFALVCGSWTTTIPAIQGRQIEELPCSTDISCPLDTSVDPCIPTVDSCTATPVTSPCPPEPSCNPCATVKPKCCLNKCGDQIQLIQVFKTETRTISAFFPLRLKKSPDIDCECPNLTWKCADEAWIKDGFLFTNFTCGKVYISYQGIMEDDEGNLLVPDHDLLNEYFEYAIKERILENLWFAGEDVERKLAFVTQRLRTARIQAVSMVNTPNYEEMKKVHDMNRKAQYDRYYSMFSSYPTFHGCYR